MDKLIINDAHCHLYAYGNDEIIDKVIQNYPQVKRICENATSINNFLTVLEISKRHPDRIIPSIGIHPYNYKEWNADIAQRMEEQLANNQSLMIGEIGLDFVDKTVDKKEQIQVFKNQVEIGIKFKRTISIHSVRSHGDMLKVFKKLFKSHENLKNINLIIHSYSGPVQIMKSLLKLTNKIYFSFSLGILDKSENEVIKYVPVENLLIETDSPFQLYDNITGLVTIDNEYCEDIKSSKLNLPVNGLKVLEHIALIKNLDINNLVEKVNDNFNNAFNII